ncbi:DUF6089 family protein [Spirosoma daeguense]
MKIYNRLMASAAAVCLLMGQGTESIAQRRTNTHFLPYSSVTFGAGSSTYFGDLAGYRQPFKSLFTLPRWNVGLGYTRQFTPHFAARAMFTWARISGDDYTFSKSDPTKYAIPFARNLHFRNDLKEFALTGIYNIIADGRTPEHRAKITPYLFGGVALLAHSPEARIQTETNGQNQGYEARNWVKLQPLHTEGQGQPGYEKPYSLVTVAIPVGIGFRYMINENFNIGLEIGYRYTFTDYLDDVGGDYAQPDALQGLGSMLADRRFDRDAARENKYRYDVAQQLFQADPSPFTTTTRGERGILPDGYLLTNLSIQYVIPSKIKCPPIR